MDQYVVQQNIDRVGEPADELNELVEEIVVQVEPSKIPSRFPSYHPTRWAVVNRLLDRVDTITNGRADWAMRLVSYLFFGGVAALINLSVFALMLLILPLSLAAFDRTLIAGVVACEISLIANFIPNDYFTFRHMSGRQRSWLARCARFHATSLVGSLLTVLLQQVFSYVLHIMPLIGQALAIILVLFYNFSFHHLFTYRKVSHHKS